MKEINETREGREEEAGTASAGGDIIGNIAGRNHPLLRVPSGVHHQSKGDTAGKTQETLDEVGIYHLAVSESFLYRRLEFCVKFTALIHHD